MDFSQLYYDLHGKKESPFSLYPELNDVEDFKFCPDFDKDSIIRYINYMYSKDTPLFKRYKNAPERKKQSAILAGITINPKVDDGVFSLRDKYVLRMVLRFLAIQNDKTWSSIVENEQRYYDNLRILLQPLDEDDEKKRVETAKNKDALSDANSKIYDRLKTLYKELVSDDKSLEEAIKKIDVVRTTPEEIALIERLF